MCRILPQVLITYLSCWWVRFHVSTGAPRHILKADVREILKSLQALTLLATTSCVASRDYCPLSHNSYCKLSEPLKHAGCACQLTTLNGKTTQLKNSHVYFIWPVWQPHSVFMNVRTFLPKQESRLLCTNIQPGRAGWEMFVWTFAFQRALYCGSAIRSKLENVPLISKKLSWVLL